MMEGQPRTCAGDMVVAMRKVYRSPYFIVKKLNDFRQLFLTEQPGKQHAQATAAKWRIGKCLAWPATAAGLLGSTATLAA